MKALLSGMGVAMVAGLVMGFAMKPELTLGDRPEGPQILMPSGGARSTGPFDDAVMTGYSGEIPEYVVGTDWTRARNAPQADAVYVPPPEPMVFVAEYDEPPPTPMPAAYAAADALPEEPISYPSLHGGQAYGEPASPPSVDSASLNPSQAALSPRL